MPLKPSHKKEWYSLVGRRGGNSPLVWKWWLFWYVHAKYRIICAHAKTFIHVTKEILFLVVKGESYFLLTMNSVILNKKPTIHWSICVWIFMASLHRQCCMDVLGGSWRKAVFLKRIKTACDFWDNLKALSWNSGFWTSWLCRSILDVCLMQILSFSKNGRRYV